MSDLDLGKPMRASRPGAGGSGDAHQRLMSQVEVAALLGLTAKQVQQLEKLALRKLRQSPVLRQLAGEMGIGKVAP